MCSWLVQRTAAFEEWICQYKNLSKPDVTVGGPTCQQQCPVSEAYPTAGASSRSLGPRLASRQYAPLPMTTAGNVFRRILRSNRGDQFSM